ncbi:MAG: head GIN domain-containing protein, partial [Ginsengibacter sp.]
MKYFIVTAFSIFIFCSCDHMEGIKGSGNIRSEKRSVNQFNGVHVSGSIDVEIRHGDNLGVEVEADDNILTYVNTEVKNGILNVDYKSNMSFSDTHAKVYVTASTLQQISSSGSADITDRDGIQSNGLIDVRVSGSGNITAQLNAPSVKAAISGSGNLVLKGKTRNFDCSVSGSGDARCWDLLSENTTISVGGSGNAHVYASVSLKATASGSGDISYRGNPQNPEIHTSGSGSVQP